MIFHPFFITGKKITALEDALFAGAAKGWTQTLYGQTLAALGAAAADNGATARGGHALQKAMSAFATDDTGLVGSFHQTILFLAADYELINVRARGFVGT